MARALRGTLAALCLLCGLSARAQSPVWAIRGAHNTVFIAESVHLLKPGDSALPRPFERAYAAAQIIVMEVDLTRIDAGEMQSFLAAHGMLHGATLEHAVGERLYRRVASEAERLGLPLASVESLEPWTVALMFDDLEYLRLGYDAESGVERQIERRAERDGKPIRGLETLDQELGELAHLPPAEQNRFLDLTVDDMHDAERDTDELLAAWRAGDTRKLASLLSSAYLRFPELYRVLITERNSRWFPQIERELADSRDYLVIVGALHVVGPGGLLERARSAGFTPRPVRAH